MQIKTFHISNTFDLKVLIWAFPYNIVLLVNTLAYNAMLIYLFVTLCWYPYCDSLSLSAHRSWSDLYNLNNVDQRLKWIADVW
jgi:hypothetical protein